MWSGSRGMPGTSGMVKGGPGEEGEATGMEASGALNQRNSKASRRCVDSVEPMTGHRGWDAG